MLALTIIDHWQCASKYKAGHVYIHAIGSFIVGVRVGCMACGIPNDVQPDDTQHGKQSIVIDSNQKPTALLEVSPGWTCGACRVRQAIQGGMLVAVTG